jgi:hypothetical protein
MESGQMKKTKIKFCLKTEKAYQTEKSVVLPLKSSSGIICVFD